MERHSTMPMYSVIIPVYNAEKTLRRCLDSLLSGDNGSADMELILVNDGSTDGSGLISEEYSRQFDKIRVINKTNGGVSSARNVGLDEASGSFCLFVDSDDYVTEDYFSALDDAVKNCSADLVQFSFCVENGTRRKKYLHKPISVQSRNAMIPLIVDSICRKTINGPWAKLYRMSIIKEHQIRFPVGVSIGEDRAFNSVYSFYCNSYAASKRIIYITNTENENSLSRRRYNDLKIQFDIADEYIERELSNAPVSEIEKEHYRNALNFGVCTEIYHGAKLMVQDEIPWTTRLKLLLQRCRTINKMHMKYPKTVYCALIALPVRLCIIPVIDAIGRKLARAATVSKVR